jgi:hypothetical protein
MAMNKNEYEEWLNSDSLRYSLWQSEAVLRFVASSIICAPFVFIAARKIM